jgi:hypothetical protein
MAFDIGGAVRTPHLSKSIPTKKELKPMTQMPWQTSQINEDVRQAYLSKMFFKENV